MQRPHVQSGGVDMWIVIVCNMWGTGYDISVYKQEQEKLYCVSDLLIILLIIIMIWKMEQHF